MFLSGLIRLAAQVEKNRACVKLCKELEPSQCIFPDILKLVETPGDSDNWTPSKLKLVKEAYCAQHNKMCKIETSKDDCGLLGAPCILFSKYGKREGFQNLEGKKLHDVSTRFQQRSGVSLHENVPDFDESYLTKNLKSHSIQRTLLDPRQFGHPNRRLRSWRICLHNKLKVWKCDLSLSELADVLLAPLDVKLALDHSCYLTASRADLMTHSVFSDKDLQGSQQKHLALFQAKLPDKQLYDLSANPNKRRRVETKESALPCLTTSSTLWSEKAGRLMLGKEQLHSLGYPSTNIGAQAARVDPVNLDNFTEASLRRMSGNGMSLPCAGFVLLMAVLFVEDK
ncbi:unnamed protein product [Cladocopium goreaui]|uniref:Uncharacterized protein n=1 Tax=Cladocopium goreaui TaxID=2562237 RepID=A0A9P1CZ74_9DINO|nr:unnamed protein product [Cladocopium goreaui]CAI3999593.1 unnamed protein product [Cladocopium goreaui]